MSAPTLMPYQDVSLIAANNPLFGDERAAKAADLRNG